jgi:hypothetical protein
VSQWPKCAEIRINTGTASMPTMIQKVILLEVMPGIFASAGRGILPLAGIEAGS